MMKSWIGLGVDDWRIGFASGQEHYFSPVCLVVRLWAPTLFRVQWVRWAVLASKSAGACYWTLTGICCHIQLKWRYTSSPPMCGCWIGLGITVSCTSGIPSLWIYRNLGVSLLNLNKSWSCWDTASVQGLCCLLSSTLCHILEQLSSVSWFTPLTQFMRDSRISSWPFVLKPNVLNVTHQLRKRGVFYRSFAREPQCFEVHHQRYCFSFSKIYKWQKNFEHRLVRTDISL